MNSRLHQGILAALAVALVVSCDTRMPTSARTGGTSPGDAPSIVIDTPVVSATDTAALFNVGDSILVRAIVTSGSPIVSVIIRADAVKGDTSLGTFEQTPRYTSPPANPSAGVRDAIIRRYLKPIDPTNLSLDNLKIIAIVTDSAGLADTAEVRARVVSGPKVEITVPASGDSVTAGVGVSITVHATHPDGVGRLSFTVRGDPTWPDTLNVTIDTVPVGGPRDLTFTRTVLIPATATPRSRLTVSSRATDINSQPGTASPITLIVRAPGATAVPRVTQVVPARSERTDTIIVKATAEQGIKSVGYIVKDTAGGAVDSVLVPITTLPLPGNVQVGIPLRLPITQQGRRLAIIAYAIDAQDRIGYSVRPNQSGSETTFANAKADSTLIMHGQTYTLPLAGTVGDLAVDVARGHVFLSNTIHNRLEVWSRDTNTVPAAVTVPGFKANGHIAVGSLPWGITPSVTAPSKDSIFVANSGGTNISRVCIANCSVGRMHEDLAQRILTRNVYVFTVLESRDPSTGRIAASIAPITSYSDRPQYIAQARTGRLYYSTRPTTFAPEGTIRWLDPDKQYDAPDPRIIWQYVKGTGGTDFRYTIFNADTVKVISASATSTLSDEIWMWDHEYGKRVGQTICVNAPGCPVATLNFPGQPVSALNPRDFGVRAAVETMRALGSDVEYVLRLDMSELPLTDTTFVAASVNAQWIAFGEGNSLPGSTGARVIMVADSTIGSKDPNFYSPIMTVRDLTENASEQVFGLALDKNGQLVASHGLQSYFTEVGDPFHLRLQGKFDSQDNGAGIALHPDADGRVNAAYTARALERTGYVASASGAIEIVDLAFFISRGRLQLKYPIYGPLRVSLPMPQDVIENNTPGSACQLDSNACVILKLYAVTQRGLIVIDLTAPDIKDGPP